MAPVAPVSTASAEGYGKRSRFANVLVAHLDCEVWSAFWMSKKVLVLTSDLATRNQLLASKLLVVGFAVAKRVGFEAGKAGEQWNSLFQDL